MLLKKSLTKVCPPIQKRRNLKTKFDEAGKTDEKSVAIYKKHDAKSIKSIELAV